MAEKRSYRVGILGATGAVGQKFVELLAGHPWFEISAVAASERSAGKRYRDAVNWLGSGSIPADIANLMVQACEPTLDCDFVFSGLDSSVANDIELSFADAGFPVISNARNHRMREDVPLLIPEVNPDHTRLIRQQQESGEGFIVTNPNCSTVGLVSALKPLHDAFGVKRVIVATMQALSGAGYPGVASLDIVGNVVPYIGGEEEKLETEPRKLLGRMTEDGIQFADIEISAHCNRVPVLDGHTECVSVALSQQPSAEDVAKVFRSFESEIDGLHLPSAPRPFIRLLNGDADPQPRRHVGIDGGMPVWIGRVRPCNVLDYRFVVLVHNTVRGAAGGAILNAELLIEEGYM
jgi:aspartate-semialdehyde dehydrogenase